MPPRGAWEGARAEYRVGDPIEASEIEARFARLGYVFDERVDAPGEAALRGRVIDIFPAAAPLPCRIEHDAGEAIYSYSPVTQRTEVPTELLLVDPASEFTLDDQGLEGADQEAPTDRQDGDEILSRCHARLETLFDYVPDAALVLDHDVTDRVTGYFELVAEAYATARNWITPPLCGPIVSTCDATSGTAKSKRLTMRVTPPSPDSFIPRSVRERQPQMRFREFLATRLAKGGRDSLRA